MIIKERNWLKGRNVAEVQKMKIKSILIYFNLSKYKGSLGRETAGIDQSHLGKWRFVSMKYQEFHPKGFSTFHIFHFSV